MSILQIFCELYFLGFIVGLVIMSLNMEVEFSLVLSIVSMYCY